MVTLFDLFDEFVELFARAVDDHEEFIIKWLADDRLGLELCQVDASIGEGLQYFYQGSWPVAGSYYQ